MMFSVRPEPVERLSGHGSTSSPQTDFRFSHQSNSNYLPAAKLQKTLALMGHLRRPTLESLPSTIGLGLGCNSFMGLARLCPGSPSFVDS